MPGAPKFLIVKPMIDNEKILMEEQKEYQSGVVMLLILIKHSRPDNANATRVLSKANDGANYVVFRELLRVIRHGLDTTNLDLKLQPTRNANKPSEIVCFSDGDYAGDYASRRSVSGFILHVLGVRDPVSRRSVSGFILYVVGVPVSSHLKAQRSVTQPSSEA